MILNGTHQLLVYVDDVNILGRSVHTIRKRAEATAIASKKMGLEVNGDKTKYLVMSRDQSAGRSHNIRTGNSSFARMGQFMYLGTTLRNQKYIQEEIKKGLKSENACYHSVQNLLSSSLLIKNVKIQVYKSTILPVVSYGCETWSLTLKEERRLRVFENGVLTRIFGPKRDEAIDE